MAFVELHRISKSFGRLEVLKGIDLEVHKGESFALLGKNGAGKTTLIKIIATLLKPDQGEIKISGIDCLEEPEKAREKIGMVSHHIYLYEELTALENLEFFGSIYGVDKDKIIEILKEVDLYERRHSLVGTFSRGMKQRLSIARALLHDPELLILDEPTTGLDIHFREWLLRKIDQLKATVILATHSLEEAKICTRFGVLHNGKLLELEKAENASEYIRGE